MIINVIINVIIIGFNLLQTRPSAAAGKLQQCANQTTHCVSFHVLGNVVCVLPEGQS
jgi:hypothetical protein